MTWASPLDPSVRKTEIGNFCGGRWGGGLRTTLRYFLSIRVRPTRSLSLIFQDLFIFWLCSAAWEILVPWPGTEPAPPTLEAQSLNHWTTREVPGLSLLNWTLHNSQESGGREKSPFMLAALTFTSLVSLSPWAGASFWLHENHALPQANSGFTLPP